ncbi:MAG TPA: hemolysin family protein [Candidatus Limnocylindrales bacterium]|nr:hemolysin family protein [Candidatus Limnocylindrales bacterium]
MSGQLETLLIVLGLLAANGFFVAAEFALVKAKPARLDALAEDGSSRAQLNGYIRDNLEAYLAACQLGITMASLGLGWVGEPAVSALLEPVFHATSLSPESIRTTSFLIGFVVFSSLHIVIGEQVPKTFAIRKPEPVALWIAYPLHLFYRFTYPLNWTLNAATGAVLSRFGVQQATHADVLTDDEIRDVIQTSEEHGELDTGKAEMLQNMFEFGNRTAAEVMLPRGQVDLLDASADADTNARVMREKGHSRFPLIDGSIDKLVGIVLAKDLFNAALAGEEEPWQDLRRFVRQPLFVPETIPVQKLFEMMRASRNHMACVVDEYGEFAGLVTLEDLLEEIVGDIADELDEKVSEYAVRMIGDHWEAHGLTSLSDIEKATALEVPADTQTNTVSGLFAEILDRLPEYGDTIEIGERRLTVLSMKDRHVEQVRIENVLPTEHESDDEQRERMTGERRPQQG